MAPDDRRARVVLAALATVCAAAPLRAQTPELRVDAPARSTMVLGRELRVPVELDNAARRDVRLEPPAEIDGLRVQVAGPQLSSQMIVVNGRVDQKATASWELRLRPTREGVFRVPALRVFDGEKWHESEPFEVEVVKGNEASELLRVRVEGVPARAYVKQPLEVAVQVEVLESVSVATGRVQRVRYPMIFVDAPWLGGGDGFFATAIEPSTDGPQIPVNRQLEPVLFDRVERDGRAFRRFTLRRRIVPSEVGALVLPAPTLQVTSDQNARVGMFGEIIPGTTDDYFAYGEDLRVEVLPLPVEGRPASFADAVGSFALSAQLDRAALRVGESVRVRFEVEGEGNAQYLDLPERLEFEGFHFLGRTEPELSATRAAATYDLRVIDDAVTEVPSIPFAWFDPAEGRYVEAATEPQPLRVEPGAETGVLAAAAEDGEAFAADISDIRDLSATPVPPAGDVAAASGRGLWLLLGCLLPWLFAGLGAWFARRRSRGDRDPLARRAREARSAFERGLRAGIEPAQALATFVAARMRWPDAAVVAPDLAARLEREGVESGVAGEAQRVVESLSAARYGGASAAVSEADVRTLAARFDVAQKGCAAAPSAATALGLWLALGLGTAAVVPAQAHTQAPTQGRGPDAVRVAAPQVEAPSSSDATEPTVAPSREDLLGRARQAYRSGDFATARAAWRRWLRDHPGHGDAWFNLGNACYRAGDPARALWAYESGLRLNPRDGELRANRDLAREALGLASSPPSFVDGLDELRRLLTQGEWQLLAVALQVLAAGCLVLGWRRRPLRALGWVLLVPALLTAFEVLVWAPARAPEGVVLERARVYAEPNADLEPIHRFERGALVDVVPAGDEGAAWRRVRFGGKRGYVARRAVAVVGGDLGADAGAAPADGTR